VSEYLLVEIDCNRIAEWKSFHDVFTDSFKFPDFYGRNMSEWIDCLTYLDPLGDTMTTVHAPDGGYVVLQIDNVASFSERCKNHRRPGRVFQCSSNGSTNTSAQGNR
jgi:RNAse (barnase) inhibitor barstar